MKEDRWVILGFVALVLLVGAMGNIEISETLPVSSVVLAVISFGYLMVYTGVTVFKSKYSQEEFDLMQKDLDIWCFPDKFRKEKMHESRKRNTSSQGTQKTVSRSKKGRQNLS